MADHVQQQILEAVQTALVAAATAASTRVYLDRVNELPQANLPAIDILGPNDAGEESIEHVTMGWPPVQQRSYRFSIASVTQGASGSPAASRNLAKQVEQALMASLGAITLGTSAIDLRLESSAEQKDGAASLPLFAVSQSWRASYHTLAGTPDAVY